MTSGCCGSDERQARRERRPERTPGRRRRAMRGVSRRQDALSVQLKNEHQVGASGVPWRVDAATASVLVDGYCNEDGRAGVTCE